MKDMNRVTNEEVFEVFVEECTYCDILKGDPNCEECGNRVLIKALEKQIPKKPVKKSRSYMTTEGNVVTYTLRSCPVCGEHIGDGEYCSKCGQKVAGYDK